MTEPATSRRIYTLGIATATRLALNPETGEFWMTEQGPNGGDEINVLKPGANYGWPIVSYGRNYMDRAVSPKPVAKAPSSRSSSGCRRLP